MNLELFIAKRISLQAKRTFSKLIVRIAIVGIMLGLGVMILSLAIVKGFKSEIREKVRGFNGDVQFIKYDLNSSYENSPFILNDQNLKQAQKYKGVEHVVPFATKPGIIKANDEVEGVILKGVDKNYDWSYFKNILVSGKTINFRDSAQAGKEIIISEVLAKRLNLKVGDDFLMYFVQGSLRKRKFEIVGIYNTGVEEVDKTYVIGDLSLIRKLNNWSKNEVGGYEIRITDFSKVDHFSYQLANFLPPQIKSISVKENYPVIFDWLSLLDVNAQIILALMLIVAVINMISALLIMILERTNMIGILKALGYHNWGIRKIFLYNASYLVGVGMILGNIFGLGLGFFQQKTHYFKLDEASYYMKFVPIQFSLIDVCLINLGTLLVCLLILLIPSMLVSKISPIKAISFK
ncbi:MAG: ABC transporter permease [Bacteroidetes bacterium]|nr:ABC transporter permease [Bacteroidota bacterium]MBU1486362.1 ABC transporter permease [Bacteroidota bacterium]MBU2268314.1 ABC transporter permease [Bacteroidota bacterium]MBU2377420.1 ABC transporter permease [Bacteroidota bacterium]